MHFDGQDSFELNGEQVAVTLEAHCIRMPGPAAWRLLPLPHLEAIRETWVRMAIRLIFGRSQARSSINFEQLFKTLEMSTDSESVEGHHLSVAFHRWQGGASLVFSIEIDDRSLRPRHSPDVPDNDGDDDGPPGPRPGHRVPASDILLELADCLQAAADDGIDVEPGDVMRISGLYIPTTSIALAMGIMHWATVPPVPDRSTGTAHARHRAHLVMALIAFVRTANRVERAAAALERITMVWAALAGQRRLHRGEHDTGQPANSWSCPTTGNDSDMLRALELVARLKSQGGGCIQGRQAAPSIRIPKHHYSNFGCNIDGIISVYSHDADSDDDDIALSGVQPWMVTPRQHRHIASLPTQA